jgi:hypothetical protein
VGAELELIVGVDELALLGTNSGASSFQ